MAAKRPDQKHPFGHGRAESIAAIVVATLLAIVGINFLKESIFRLKLAQAANFSTVVIIIFSVSAVLKEGLAQFALRAGKRLDSKALLADGWHHRSDAVASVVIVIGALFGRYFWWIDGVLGITVSLFILFATLNIFRNSISALLGERPDPYLEDKIKNILKEVVPFQAFFHHFHVHIYGHHKEISFHIRLPRDLTLEDGHAIATIVEGAVRSTLNMEATVHLEPLKE
jgi:cation diffusion facilitator family transporter